MSGKAPGRQPNKTSQGQGSEGQEGRRRAGAGGLYLRPQAEEERKEAAANGEQKPPAQCLKWRWPVVRSTTPYLRGRGQRERQRTELGRKGLALNARAPWHMHHAPSHLAQRVNQPSAWCWFGKRRHGPQKYALNSPPQPRLTCCSSRPRPGRAGCRRGAQWRSRPPAVRGHRAGHVRLGPSRLRMAPCAAKASKPLQRSAQ